VTTTSTPGGVRLELDGGLAVITIDRPEVRNAIGFATVDELHDALARVEDSPAAVTVLTGGGDRAFVSGGDLKELAAVRTHAEATEMAGSVRDVLDRLSQLPMPVLAAMNGHALGGGAEVAVAADIRIAASDIRIGFSQVTLGIMPAWGGIERLVNLVGRSRALLAITSGTQYDATAAHAMGLVDLVIPREMFDAEWQAIAGRMATLAPGAARSMKAVVAAAAPAVRHDTRAAAIDHFAHLWAAPAHWDAVDAMQQQRKG
jgi:enoyl-CoA hydratase/carnithine racemase